MTRINLVAPSKLVTLHLVAEYRELPRIYQLVRNAMARGETAQMAASLSPRAYTLGTGHCRFFYTRLAWLTRRFHELVAEMQRRGIKTTHDTVPAWTSDIPTAWWGEWEPTPACVAINVGRINLRLVGMGMAEHQIILESSPTSCAVSTKR